jgi:ketosteroid isomerase-like protein
MPSADTRRIVEAYFAAWTTKDVEAAYALLADDLAFAGPNASFATREAFLPALRGFAAMTRNARVVELIADGDRAALLYDCELPAPVGAIRIASFFRVEGDKIRWYDTRFDAETFRRLQAERAK